MQTIFPVLRYDNARNAIRSLCDAFGFVELFSVPESGPFVRHAQLRLGTNIIMLGSVRPAEDLASPRSLGTATQACCVFVDDLDGHYERARAAGVEITRPPTDTDFGAREYHALDLEGHQWTFGTDLPEPGLSGRCRPGTGHHQDPIRPGTGVTVDTTIREYESRDLASCRELWCELTQRHRDIYQSPSIGGADPGAQFDDYLGKKNLAGPWVVVEDSTVVALSGLLLNGVEAEIEPVVVTAACRSRGIGTALIERMKLEATARGVRSLSIRPVARNIEAIACFHRAGFSILGHLDMFLELPEGGASNWDSGIRIHGLDFSF